MAAIFANQYVAGLPVFQAQVLILVSNLLPNPNFTYTASPRIRSYVAPQRARSA
jgi:hypothetical protein